MNEPTNSNPPSQLEETTEALWGLPDEDDRADDDDEVEEETADEGKEGGLAALQPQGGTKP